MTGPSHEAPQRRLSADDNVDLERGAGIEKAEEASALPEVVDDDLDHDHDHDDEKSPSSSGTMNGDDAPAADASVPAAPGKEAEDPESKRTKLETFLIMFALCLALFLAALDMTIITTAVPTISSHFNSSAGYIWIGSAYLLGNATFVPTWGKISDIFGRKPVLIAAVATFWVGSLLCAVSTSMGMLIAARAIQGVGGGGTIVLPNICISDLFSLRKRGLYFGVLGCVWAVASAIGPILGGVFTQKVSWRWCFYINLPLSGVAMVILVFVLKLYNPRTPVKQGLAAIDWVGSLLVIGGTLMLLLGLEFGGVQFPWSSATVICLIVFGAFTIGVFMFYEWKVAKYPIMPVRLFTHRPSLAAYALSFMHAFTFMSGSYWLPLYFQAVVGANSLLSGVYLLPFVMSLSTLSALIGVFIKKTGLYKVPIMAGMFVMTLGFGLFTDLGSDKDWAKIIIFQIIAGIGIGPNFQAPLIALQTNVQPADIGAATASFSFLRQIGTSVSVVVGGVIFNNQMQKQQGRLVQELGPKLAALFTGQDAAANVHIVRTLSGHESEVTRGAYWNAIQKMYIVYVCFAFVGFLFSFFLKQVSLSKESQHKEHKTGLKTLIKERTKDSVKIARMASRT